MILKNSAKIFVISVLVLFFSVSTIYAIELQTWTIVSGGGTLSSENYDVDLSLGSYLVGTTSSPSFTVEIGILSIHRSNLTPITTDVIIDSDDDSDSGSSSSSGGGGSGGGGSGGGGSGGGGSGGGGSISGGSSDEKNLNAQLYEISWNLCNSNMIQVLAGPASNNLYVTIRTPSTGLIVTNLASEQPFENIMMFEANIAQDTSFVLVKAEFVLGRDYNVDKQIVNFDTCDGKIIFQEFVPPESNVDDGISDVYEIPVPASFVDTTNTPQYYIDRYHDEPLYKEWFDENYPQYSSIYHAVGMSESDYLLKTAIESEIPVPAPFVDPTNTPQYYIDRYHDEPLYKEWFDENYPQYSSIYHAVGMSESDYLLKTAIESEIPVPAPFVDPTNTPQYYIDRYHDEPLYKEWFDENYPQYSSIYHAVGMSEFDYILITDIESEIPVSTLEFMEINNQLILYVIIIVVTIIITLLINYTIINKNRFRK